MAIQPPLDQVSLTNMLQAASMVPVAVGVPPWQFTLLIHKETERFSRVVDLVSGGASKASLRSSKAFCRSFPKSIVGFP